MSAITAFFRTWATGCMSNDVTCGNTAGTVSSFTNRMMAVNAAHTTK